MKVRYLLLALASVALFSACDMMKDDVDDTYCGLFINFKYDYNLQRADMFKDHVGGVTLYVFDSEGRFIRTYEDNNVPQMGTLLLDGSYAYCMHITDLPDGDYRFIALANQKSYAETLSTPGAKYRRTVPALGAGNEQLTVTLDRTPGTDGPDGITYSAMVSNAAPLDTLWHGMTGTEPVAVKNNGYQVTTISLTRDTKMLTIGLHHLDDDKRMSIDTNDYDYFIIDNNGRLGYNNALLDDEDLVYTPFHKWNTNTIDDQGQKVDQTAHASIAFNRLILHDKLEDDAILVIRAKDTGRDVATINLAQFLQQGRNAIDTYRYGPQEYLDRGYDFYMDFFLKGDEWKEVQLSIGIGLNVLSWAKRIQNVNLE